MFADHPVRKEAFLDEKKTLENFYLSSILDKWALKLCLMIIQVEKKPS